MLTEISGSKVTFALVSVTHAYDKRLQLQPRLALDFKLRLQVMFAKKNLILFRLARTLFSIDDLVTLFCMIFFFEFV